MTEMETKEIVTLFEQKPEIDFQLSFYTETMQAVSDAIEAIQHRLKFGGGDKAWYLVFGVLPVYKREIQDKYNKSKLVIEQKDLENELFRKKEFYKHWLSRSHEYDSQFAQKLEECNKYFNFVSAEAEQVAESNIRLRTSMADYKNPDNDNKLKVEYYLYMKQEVENRYKHEKRKFKLPEIVPDAVKGDLDEQ